MPRPLDTIALHFMLALRWAGWQIGERHMQTGMTLDRSWDRRLKDSILRCDYVSAYELDDDHLDAALDVLDTKKIEHLWGYPGSLYFLAKRALQRGWNRPLRSLVTWGDNLFKHYREHHRIYVWNTSVRHVRLRRGISDRSAVRYGF